MNENDLKRAVGAIRMNDIQKERIIKNLTVRRRKPVIKVVGIAAILALTLTAGVVFAQVTGTWGNLFNTGDTGLQKALEYDYVQNVHMDYVMSEDVGVKVETVMLDNSTFAIVYDFKLPKAIKGFDWIDYDMVISDENNDVLFGAGKGMVASVTRSSTSEDGVIIKQSEILHNSSHNFPKSSELYFEFTNLKFMKDSKILKEYNGKWAWQIDLWDKFIDRAEYPYEVVNENPDLKIIYATLTSTGFDLKWEYNGDDAGAKTDLTAILIDSNGNEYQCERNSASFDENGNTIITASYPITRFTATVTYTLAVGDRSVDLKETVTLYSQIKNYISSILTKEYDPYYSDFNFVVYGYNENIDGNSFTAALFLEMTTKEIGASYFQLQVNGEFLPGSANSDQGGIIDEKSVVIMTYNDGTNKYDIPLEDYYPRNIQ